jgi:(E)-4-hydroxy-3-methylbut-2-enyl-diphosphate synthase
MEKIKRRTTYPVRVKNVVIGGAAPVAIQSMTNTSTSDPEATLKQIASLYEAGCELVRVAVPDRQAAEALHVIVEKSPLPVIADIHFDAELAHLAIENGAAKIRINPGNIGGTEKLLKLAEKASAYNVPIRVGVNAGSLDRATSLKYGGATPAALCESALTYLHILEKAGFNNTVVSLKASDVYTTIAANRLLAAQTDAPIHLGVTEAGPPESGIIKGAIGIGSLLSEGIGDTIRVSLTASPVEEIGVARAILQALNLRLFGPELISCPTCGRCEADLLPLVKNVESLLKGYSFPLRVAVMGCAVNGPGEAREAEVGVSAGKKQGIVFRAGKVIKTVKQDQLLTALKEEIDKYISEHNSFSAEEENI